MDKITLTEGPELLSMKAAQALLGNRSRQWFYDKLRKDPTFPRPVRTNPHRVEWRRSELAAWVEMLPRAEFDGLDAIDRKRAMGGR